MPNKLTGQ